jgi:hypothetical protein
MKKVLLLSFVVAMLIAGCGQRQGTDRTEGAVDQSAVMISAGERTFLENLASLCGQSFSGQEVYVQPGRESWAGKNLVMHVTVCEENQVHIPFHIDDDQSRTWMFMVDDGRLRFRHDHRHEDGTPEDQTLYGGYSDGSGDAYRQYFPADEYTVELLNDDRNRQWNVMLNEEMTRFTYQLLYHGEVVFAAEFDLTAPINL